MITHSDILDLYYQIDRNKHKLDDICLEKMHDVRMKLGIKLNIENIRCNSVNTNKKVLKDGSIDKVISDIKINLNKITEKTYDKIHIIIINIVNSFNTSDFIEEVCDLIFNIITKNKMSVGVYSKLFKELCNNNDRFNNILNDNIDKYCLTFNDIKYVSPNENYNKFCEFVKDNENKNTLSLFYLYCFKEDIISIDKIITIIEKCIELLKINLDYDGNNSICEELISNIYILLKGIKDYSKEEIKKMIEKIDKDNIKLKKNFNNKIRFKIMDIEDLIKNN
jgi:hypothetical protein